MKIKLVTAALAVISAISTQGQKPNWQNLDLKIDSVFGISTEQAYQRLLRGRTPQNVIVAVLDDGLDTAHEALKHCLWTNKKEIPCNGLDDDHNGYIDDFYGWNFTLPILAEESQLLAFIRIHQNFYDSLSLGPVPEPYRAGFAEFRSKRSRYFALQEYAQSLAAQLQVNEDTLADILAKIATNNPTRDELLRYQPATALQHQVIGNVLGRMSLYPDFAHYKHAEIDSLAAWLNQPVLPSNASYTKKAVGPDIQPDDLGLIIAGSLMNNDDHGTHVAGIIAASSDRPIPMHGIANNAIIMPVKTLSAFSLYADDSILACAIHYAVDNGAKVINLSFKTPLDPVAKRRRELDSAIRYAMAKDVLIVHAAGNDGEDIDQPENAVYPNKLYSDSLGSAGAWITVGASGYRDDSTLVPFFSNYGKTNVDVFAPGVDITSTVPGSQYLSFNGTSMAAPVVAGLAALIRGYYPNLTATQVKDIILKSVVKPGHAVMLTPHGKQINTLLSDICVSGGVVNAVRALELAGTYPNKFQ